MRTVALFVMIALGLVTWGCGDTTVSTEDDHTRLVTLPDGTRIRVEVATHPNDMLRGLMYRESLAPDRGMLFVYASPGKYSFWMFQVKFPLDILWMDASRTVVEISESAPPCPEGSKKCPTYGGKYPAQFVLELAAGSVAKHNLRVGNTLTF